MSARLSPDLARVLVLRTNEVGAAQQRLDQATRRYLADVARQFRDDGLRPRDLADALDLVKCQPPVAWIYPWMESGLPTPEEVGSDVWRARQELRKVNPARARSEVCEVVLNHGVRYPDGVSARELAQATGLTLEQVRVENSALKRMGLATCLKAGPVGTWVYGPEPA